MAQKKISDKDSSRIFSKVDIRLTIKQISEVLELNYETAARIVKCYLTSGSVQSKKGISKKCLKLSIEQRQEILTWLDKNCSITLKNLLFAVFNPPRSYIL